MTVVDLAYSRLDGLRRYAGSLSWSPLLSFSRSTILSVLRNIEQGELTIVDTNGETTFCGKAIEGRPATSLKIHKETFWVRMLLFADMVCGSTLQHTTPPPNNSSQGFAESYMLGEVSCPDLTAFFEVP